MRLKNLYEKCLKVNYRILILKNKFVPMPDKFSKSLRLSKAPKPTISLSRQTQIDTTEDSITCETRIIKKVKIESIN